MDLPSVKDLEVFNKKVLLRTNYDVSLIEQESKRAGEQEFIVADEARIVESLPTIKYLLSQKAKLIIISHLGRPKGKMVLKLSLKPTIDVLNHFLEKKIKKKIPIFPLGKIKHLRYFAKKKPLIVLENLRFDSGEEANDKGFAKELASLADFYVNDAFAVSHRSHASIVGIPQFLPSAFGFDFLEEIKALEKVREKPKRPVVVILGGLKKGKLKTVVKLASWADWILIGGKAATYKKEVLKIKKAAKNLVVATRKGEDITLLAVEKFAKVIAKAKTVVWSGPLGEFEDRRYEKGTKLVGETVARSGAYKVIGGGGTKVALKKFGLIDKVDYVSSGGGAMLTFLAQGTLAGIKAIRNKIEGE